jgi:hypothetical protein
MGDCCGRWNQAWQIQRNCSSHDTNIMIERNMNLMSNSLPNDDLPNLQVGVPRFAGHNLWATSVHDFSNCVHHRQNE